MRAYFLLHILLFIPLYSISQNTWTQKQSNTEGLVYSASFSISIYGYVVTGFTSVGFVNHTWRYDAWSDTWSQMASMGSVGRQTAVAFVINDTGYVGMGSDWNNTPLGDLWQYDVSANSWTQKASIPVARYWPTALYDGNRAFVTCGANSIALDSAYNDLWEYDAVNDSWIQRASLPGAKRYAASGFNCNGRLFLFGGSGLDLWEYNPGTDSWMQRAALPGVIGNGCFSFGIGDAGYVGAGLGYSSFWRYDVLTDSWSSLPSFTSMDRDGAFALAFPFYGKAYVGGGIDHLSNTYVDTWEFSIYPVFIDTGLLSFGIRLYPNPVRSSAYLIIDDVTNLQDGTWTIYSVTGEKVRSMYVHAGAQKISLGDLKPGVYLHELIAGENRSGGKFVKLD